MLNSKKGKTFVIDGSTKEPKEAAHDENLKVVIKGNNSIEEKNAEDFGNIPYDFKSNNPIEKTFFG